MEILKDRKRYRLTMPLGSGEAWYSFYTTTISLLLICFIIKIAVFALAGLFVSYRFKEQEIEFRTVNSKTQQRDWETSWTTGSVCN